MDKLKKLQMLARVLREHRGYKKNKESDSSIRFDFKFNKENGMGEPSINIFNAEKGANLFLWEEFVELTHAFGLSCYVTYDKFDLKEVIFKIY